MMHPTPRWNRTLLGSVVTVFWAILPAGPASAQRTAGTEPQRMTLEQAVARGRASSENVAMARAGAQRARAEVRQAKSGGLPQLGLAFGYTRTLESEYSNVVLGDSTGPISL